MGFNKQAGFPKFPQIVFLILLSVKTWEIKEANVDFPFVPVIPIMIDLGLCSKYNSISLSNSTL